VSGSVVENLPKKEPTDLFSVIELISREILVGTSLLSLTLITNCFTKIPPLPSLV
jgi:hypothetical protein